MNSESKRTLVALASAIILPLAAWAGPVDKEKNQKWSFEEDAVEALPSGWKIEGTQQDGPLATWAVTEEASAPDGKKALTLTSPNHTSSSTFNLCWTNAVTFKDGEIEVKLKANAGAEDQGGGPIWRVRDKDNYYICRANPLESNLRVYFVKEGKRKQLGSATVDIASGAWQGITIRHVGSHMECLLNGKKLLDVDDSTFPDAGGVGVWTKADAATSFDGLEVHLNEAAETTPPSTATK